jgi:hypothetical protein
MAYEHQDFKVRKNTATHRDTTELWDVVCAGVHITTVRGLEKADAMAEELNKDPWYLERGQKLIDRQLGLGNHEKTVW